MARWNRDAESIYKLKEPTPRASFNNVSPFDALGTGAPSASENKWSKRLQDGHSPDDIGVAIGQGRVRPVEFLIFDTATKRVND